jgi:hypothetical protein
VGVPLCRPRALLPAATILPPPPPPATMLARTRPPVLLRCILFFKTPAQVVQLSLGCAVLLRHVVNLKRNEKRENEKEKRK